MNIDKLEYIHQQLAQFIADNVELSLQARLFAKTINLINDIKLQKKNDPE